LTAWFPFWETRTLNVISRKRIREFVKLHPPALAALDHWHRVARRASWKNLERVRQDFRHADQVGPYTVFNIAGNHFRLIAKIDYRAKLLLIRDILTHSDYDKGLWKR
jgi:mRNA interferase HigB